MTSQIGIPETIDLALHLHPDADSVAVIGSDSSIDWPVAHSELLRHQGKVQEVDIIGPPNSQMLKGGYGPSRPNGRPLSGVRK